MKRPRWLKRGASVSWDELKAWAEAHGAHSDLIEEIRIGGRGYPVVQITGFERNAQGNPYIGVDGEPARFESQSILRFLP